MRDNQNLDVVEKLIKVPKVRYILYDSDWSKLTKNFFDWWMTCAMYPPGVFRFCVGTAGLVVGLNSD